MNKCDCYFKSTKHHPYASGQCNGTREQDPCNCGGDKSKCDFYEHVRKEGRQERRGITPEIAEKIRIDRGLGKGTKLRILRVQRGLSQAELAKRSGVSLRSIQHFENSTANIDQTKLITYYKLCSTLDCKITDLLEDEDLINKFNEVK